MQSGAPKTGPAQHSLIHRVGLSVLPRSTSSPPAGEPTPVRRTSLPREGFWWLAASAGLAFAAWYKGINLILLLSYLLLFLWCLNWLAARRSLRGLHARVVQAGRIRSGELARKV